MDTRVYFGEINKSGRPVEVLQSGWRAGLAWQLIGHFGIITSKVDGEDSAGRSKISEISPRELVDKAFAIADAYADKCEERGELRIVKTPDVY